ncbi:MAG: ribose-phosphate pyrophosphokinase [bacterium]|nr:ribose-phosphate pyrophosphokinase [bacterium]
MESLKIFSGRANQELAAQIAKQLNTELGKITIRDFADSEIFVQVNENVRGKDAFVIQPTCNPGNFNIMELLIITDALRRSSAKRITLVVPYFGYARQDRKDKPHVPVTSKLVANLMVAAGANRILTMDLHADQIQGFFDIPVDHLFAAPVFKRYFKEEIKLQDFVIVSPDVGAVFRSRYFAKQLDTEIAIIDKRRPEHNVSEVMHIIGNVKDKNAILLDDIADTAGTLCNAAKALKDQGARDVYACITHPVLSGNAYEKIEKSVIKQLITTDTIPLKKESEKIKVISVSKLFADAIYYIHMEKSLGELFLE